MTTDLPIGPEARLMRVGRSLRGSLDGEPTELGKRQAFERFQVALQRQRNTRRRAAYGLSVAAAIAFLGTGSYLAWPDPAITFETAGVTEPSSGYIRVGEDQAAASVAFSDGSELLVRPESQARIAELTSHGARVALEGGSLHLKVSPKPNASWSVEAGPYRIHVTGTEFDVVWRTPGDVLEIVMQEGSVSVEGPMTSKGIQVAAGERLVANLVTSEVRLGSAAQPVESIAAATPAAPAAVSDSALKETEESVPRANPAARSQGSSSAGYSPHSASWAQLMKQSGYQQIVAEAQQRGLEDVLNTANVGDLAILADAARYSGQASVASRALVAARQRFAGSRQSRSAAFMLGRVAEDHLRDDTAALSWYTTYLQESPSGPFASEALGRKMGLVRQSRGGTAAESLAESYLKRYPKGPYATAARKILKQ